MGRGERRSAGWERGRERGRGGDGDGDGGGTGVETRRRTPDENGDGKGDGSEDSSGDGNEDEDNGNGNRNVDRIGEGGSEAKKRKKPQTSRRHVGNEGDLGETRENIKKKGWSSSCQLR